MDPRTPALATASLSALLALVVQFLLGVAVNLFVTIPTDHPGAKPPNYFGGVVASVTWAVLHGPLLLQLHTGFGLVLVVGSVYLLVQGILMKRGRLVAATVFGFLGTLGAGFNGGSFLNYNENFSSMLMATGFAIAVVAYLFTLYLSLSVSSARQPA
ncbi:MAG: hypothetical protein M3072_10065 [Candidatus Dormibacteraeota bacterium]|nr:hypothetical protein [Candidatus Dormibacteraeota bacterium]